MFGHQDNKDSEDAALESNVVTQPTDNHVADATSDSVGTSNNDTATTPDEVSGQIPNEPTTAPTTDNSSVMPSALPDDASMPNLTPDVDEHHNDVVEPDHADQSEADLLGIKQQALKQLSPLVNHLDQTPEEKFKTIMMMIQASDDQSLIQSAYDAAQNITDEKVRAQALLDIVNEINYFSHPHDSNPA